MKRYIKGIILLALCMSLLCSCNSSGSKTTVSIQSDDSQTTTCQTTVPVTAPEASPEDIKMAIETAKEFFDAAQAVADKYSTAGACIMSDVFKSSDGDGSDAEKINIRNMILQDFTKDGIWAFKLDNFKVISVVYSPYENSGIIARYPDEYTGDIPVITSENIDSFL